ncbi:hypothetical protein ETAE_2524 [Edwardsiella piscicida]|uniref:Uncharacterized protein n=2 Tax=Edwardsiella TaxID=635 RepID=A0A0H3DSJ0_EDWTF|nr:hypothetical protein ETAE_2524 [Edwardsiella tarda EIB202]ADM42370.1 hypothetical protein ETAF_2267 [Edwardsiella tarda FL6-60]
MPKVLGLFYCDGIAYGGYRFFYYGTILSFYFFRLLSVWCDFVIVRNKMKL